MTFAIRADASQRLGHGHVMRCLALADALAARDGSVVFVCREDEGNLCERIEARGFTTLRLEAKADFEWQRDADETRAVLDASNSRPAWLIVDHYDVDARWTSALRASADRIMVIDDLANRPHDCDLLLDQNLVAGMRERYASRLPAVCGQLLGPDYAILRQEYAELHDQVTPRTGPIRRLLIFFGGVDADRLTGRVLSALSRLCLPGVLIDVVITDSNPSAGAIRQAAEASRSISVHENLLSLAPLMAKADFSVGAGGSATWERLCMGLPSLVVTVAENQRPIAQELHRLGLIEWLGDQNAATEDMLVAALGARFERGLDKVWSERCRSVVDGRGAVRIASVLTLSAESRLHVRAAGPGDEGRLLDWANDPYTRERGFHPDMIPASDHHKWFEARLRDLENCHLFIVETAEGVPLGQVRFERHEAFWEVHYSLASPFRGRGVGKALLNAALHHVRDRFGLVTIVGQVKPDNIASRRIFESLGFTSRRPAAGDDPIRYECML